MLQSTRFLNTCTGETFPSIQRPHTLSYLVSGNILRRMRRLRILRLVDLSLGLCRKIRRRGVHILIVYYVILRTEYENGKQLEWLAELYMILAIPVMFFMAQIALSAILANALYLFIPPYNTK